MNPLRYLRTSLEARISLLVTVFVTVVFVVALVLMARFSKNVVRAESLEETFNLVENAALEMDNHLHLAVPSAALYEEAMRESQRVKEAKQEFLNAKCLLQGKGDRYKAEESSYWQLNEEGRNVYVFYAALDNPEWGIALVCPESDIMAEYNRIQTYALLIVFAGLLLLVIICLLVIRWYLKPLRQLADTTRRITDGHFDERVPETGRKDEIGRLEQSFSKMQRSLSDYIREIRQKTAALRQHNDELQQAYERAQEDIRVKTTFLGKVTDKAKQPINTINSLIAETASSYQVFTPEKMNQVREQMDNESKSITALLEQMLLTSQESGKTHTQQQAAGLSEDKADSVPEPDDYEQRNQSLALRLGLRLLIIVTITFIVAVNFLFMMAKDYVRHEAVGRATQLLDNSALRMASIMDEAQSTADSIAQYTLANLQPDSIITCTRRVLEGNPNLYSCSVNLEPYFFKEYGKYFSIYTVRDGNTIVSGQYGSDDFQYFDFNWYQEPKRQNHGVWIDPYTNKNPESDYTLETITTYTRPLHAPDGRFIGVVAVDLMQKWLSLTITSVSPYPHSSSIMTGKDGTYLVHPDTAKLMTETIFSDPDPRAREEVIPLGKAMISGQRGTHQLIVDGNPAYVFYRPIVDAGWSIAIVCPESDVFSSYNRLQKTVWTVIVIGLIIILLLSYQIIRKTIAPLELLTAQAHDIANGEYNEILPETSRADAIGQLQNSFVQMQRAISGYVGDIRQMNRKLEQSNKELAEANALALEAEKKKTDFVQDMAHQIRTPLNIINGFTQVLSDNFHELPEEETENIFSMMKDNARKVTRIGRMLLAFAAADSTYRLNKRETFSCNELCREVAGSIRLISPSTVRLEVTSTLPDSLTVSMNKEHVFNILSELLENANKFTQQGTITLSCGQPDDKTIAFTVTDTGIGIADNDRQRIFSQFTKLNLFTEGIGLGLPLSKRAAQLLGGDLTLDADYHDGARFVLTVPV